MAERCHRRHWRQHRGEKRGSSAAAGVAAVAAAACWQRGGGGGQRVGSATAAGMAAAVTTTVLPPRATAVAMKTPTATAMAGAQITINNQLNAVMATAKETVTMTGMMMTIETKATAAA